VMLSIAGGMITFRSAVALFVSPSPLVRNVILIVGAVVGAVVGLRAARLREFF
jgi:ABC-type uncharacterized transport system permease subunit